MYGYVTASDALGDAYVMPMDNVLQNIKSALGVRDVRLYQMPDLAPLHLLRNMQDQNATQEHASVTVMQPGTPCGSLNGVIYTHDRSLDSGYGTATTTPQAPEPQLRALHLAVLDADTGSSTSAGSYTDDRYEVFDPISKPRSPPFLLDNEVPSNFTSPYEDSPPTSEAITDRQAELMVDEERAVTEPFKIPKDEGQPWRPQPSRWQTTKNAVSRFRSIFRSDNNESRSKKKSIADNGPQAIQSK